MLVYSSTVQGYFSKAYSTVSALNMEDEKLIECVRKYEFLYNLRHPKYMDNVKKDMAWKEISEELKQPPVSCKQRWQGLRDAYRRAVNKRKGKSDQEIKNIKKWKYEHEMSFVVPFFIERKTAESTEMVSDEERCNSKEAIEFQNPYSYLDVKMDNTPTDPLVVPGPSNTGDIPNEDESTPTEDIPAKKVKVKKKSKASAVVMLARFLDKQNKLPHCKHDELDRFFLTVSDTVKKFPPYLQAVAKNKIFSLVSEMELQHLAPPSLANASKNEFPLSSGV